MSNNHDTARLERSLAQVRAIRHVGGKIIDFLAQLEDFQKRLWLKKKFILETHWCVTLDRVPEAMYAEIAANSAQREEWIKLYAADEIAANLGTGDIGWQDPPDIAFLKANPYLIVDTRHFDRNFTDRLLAALSEAGPLDAQTDGLLIHGENFQALNLLQARYKGRVKCIYIDPPYNTDASAIIYKNGYKHSSWLSLMQDRLLVSKKILDSEDGFLCCTIDDVEQKLLSQLIESVFGEIAGMVAIRIKPSGRPIPTGFALSHEYALFARVNPDSSVKRLTHSEEQIARYGEEDGKGKFFWEMFRKAGSGSNRKDRPTMFYPFFFNEKENTIRLPKMEYQGHRQAYKLLEKPGEDEVEILPIKDDGTEGRWYFGYERAKKLTDEFKAVQQDDKSYKIYWRRRLNKGVQPTTHWSGSKYSATEHGTALLKSLFGEQEIFSYPKSIHAVKDCLSVSGASENKKGIILDYFAGSGTTGHAVINLNREDGGRRKYLLVEMGHHFDTVLLPRIKKVTYSKDWKDGKPVSREGVSQLFKTIRLESYEDTMDSLELNPPAADVLAENADLAEDYRLRYMLGEETSESAGLLGKDFKDPFAYTLSVVRDGIRKESPADLPETFNYLLGLRVHTRQTIDGVLAITGKDAQGQHCLILWRNLDHTDNQAINQWLTRHRTQLPKDLDIIYTNGDHTLNAIQTTRDNWTAKTIEPIFRELMFEEKN